MTADNEPAPENGPQEPPAGAASGAMNGAFGNINTIMGIPVKVQVVLGTAKMLVSDLMKLSRGAVIPLDHRVGEPVDIVVNGRIVARGEVVVVEDDNSRFGVSLTEIVKTDRSSPQIKMQEK